MLRGTTLIPRRRPGHRPEASRREALWGRDNGRYPATVTRFTVAAPRRVRPHNTDSHHRQLAGVAAYYSCSTQFNVSVAPAAVELRGLEPLTPTMP